MRRIARSLVVLLVAIVLVGPTAGLAGARGKWVSATSTALDDGRLQVIFTERGLGKRNTSYRLEAGFYITWTCDAVYAGNTGGGGPSWQAAEQYSTLTPVKGVVEGSLMHRSWIQPVPDG